LPEEAKAGSATSPAPAELEENKLQNRFKEYIEREGGIPETVNIKLPNLKGAIRPDFILRDRGLVIEVKPTISREHVRLAIGQVLDYSHLLGLSGEHFSPSILLPSDPAPDLAALAKSVGIGLIIERPPTDFEFM
jgi:hypothetical protein